jgi:hypothetical protein
MGFNKSVSKIVSDTWVLEILLLLVSWVSMSAIVGLLVHYNQKPIVTWLELSLNAMISILATIFKSALLFALSSCLGQWTYISFSSRRHRQLSEFVIYDSASRGSLGSLSLLWKTRLSSWAAIGACTTLLLFFVDPFFQQIISLSEAQTATEIAPATVPRALQYDKGSSQEVAAVGGPMGGRMLSSFPDFSMHAAIFSGLSGVKGIQAVDARCPTATCEWKKYHTLAICSTFSDLTQKISKVTVPYSSNSTGMFQFYYYDGLNAASTALTPGTPIDYHRLPMGLYIEEGPIGHIRMVSRSTTNRTETLSFRDTRTLLWSIAVLQRSTSTDPAQMAQDFKAYEIGLSLCVKEIISTSINGTLIETARDIDATIVRGGTSNNKTAIDPNSGTLAQIWSDERDDLEFESGITIAQHSLNGIAVALSSTFAIMEQANSTGFYMTSGNETTGVQYKPNSMERIYKSSDPKATFESIAESMTNNLRANDARSSLVTGTQSITVYRVRWIWISLPATTLFGGTVFLLLAMYMTHKYRAPLWKSSALAVLNCGAQTENTLNNYKKISTMQDVAENTLVTIFPEQDKSEDKVYSAPSKTHGDIRYREVSAPDAEGIRHL